ncbi:hypothetical protein HDV57DRAFT_486294 [Trichoderma longibrachiatum]
MKKQNFASCSTFLLCFLHLQDASSPRVSSAHQLHHASRAQPLRSSPASPDIAEMQNNPGVPPAAQTGQNLARQILHDMSELKAILHGANNVEFPEIFDVVRAVGNRFQKVVDGVRQMEAEILHKENLLLRAAERVQLRNLTLRQIEQKTAQQERQMMCVANLMEVVDSRWEVLQGNKEYYRRLKDQMHGIYRWISHLAKSGRPPVVVDAAQDNRSSDGTASGAQASDGITEGITNNTATEMEESDEESDEEMEEEMEEEVEVEVQ